MIRVGVDFGGTKIEAAVLDGEGGFLSRRRVATPPGYEAAIEAVCELVAQVEAEAGGGGGPVGVGGPGSVSPATGLLRNSNSTMLNGRPLPADLETALGRPVRYANDANCLALSEAADGAGVGADPLFAVIVGTGCGGGLAAGGRLVSGANAIAGEWGHTPLPWSTADEHPGPACWCGRRGCLETWLCGPAFSRDHREATGRTLAPTDIAEAARAGDPGAVASMARYVDRLARGLAMVCNIVDPEAIVLGGGVSNIPELYERLPAAIAPYVFTDRWAARIAPARWGDSSGVRGAAWLWDAAG
ncbi:ROK family protein [Phenylobacterium sp.]|jgi:fructokinase|uniref:ROK family protein n=1 Tax=Phenylobacterium sp. TaxID=1871053 RepID=UPI002F95B372